MRPCHCPRFWMRCSHSEAQRHRIVEAVIGHRRLRPARPFLVDTLDFITIEPDLINANSELRCRFRIQRRPETGDSSSHRITLRSAGSIHDLREGFVYRDPVFLCAFELIEPGTATTLFTMDDCRRTSSFLERRRHSARSGT